MSDVHAASGSSAPDEGAQQRRTSWTVIGVLGGMGAIGFVLITALVAAPLFVHAVGGSGKDHATNHIADIPLKPEPVWEYNYVPATQEYVAGPPRVVPVGDDAMLVVTLYDYWGWQQENVPGNWYPEIGDHYSVAYAAGLEFVEAEAEYEILAAEWEQKYDAAYRAWEHNHEQRLAAYRAGNGDYPEWDWDVSMIDGDPPQLPLQSDFLAPDLYQPGYYAGWEDAVHGLAEGESLPQPPPDPPWNPSATLVDLQTGEELWTLAFTQVVEDLYFGSPIDPVWLAEPDLLVFRLPLVYEGQQPKYELVTVSPTRGEVLSQRTVDAQVQLAPRGRDLVVFESTYDTETGERNPGDLYALNPTKLDDEPRWIATDVNADSMRAVGNYVFAQNFGTAGSVVLDAASGQALAWGQDMFVDDEQGAGVFYEPVGNGSMIRIEAANARLGAAGPLAGSGVHMRAAQTNGSIQLSGINVAGEDTWVEAVPTGMLFLGGDQLYIGHMDTDGGVVEELMRLDPRSGEPMWEAPSDRVYTGVLMTTGDVLLVLDQAGTGVVAIDATSGEELYGEETTSSSLWTHQWVSDNYYYFVTEEGQLLAHFIPEPGWVWSIGFDPDSEAVVQVGQHLALLNVDERTISLLD